MSLDLKVIAVRPTAVWARNITHNLGRLACGIYQLIWHPDEIDGLTAGDAVPLLEAGLAKRKDDHTGAALAGSMGLGSV